jgi:hypothetical protein
MKKIWNEEQGEMMNFFDNFISIVKFKHGMLYHEIIRDLDTGKLEAGWVPEEDFDVYYRNHTIKRSDFVEVTNEEMVDLIKRKFSPTMHLTQDKK